MVHFLREWKGLQSQLMARIKNSHTKTKGLGLQKGSEMQGNEEAGSPEGKT